MILSSWITKLSGKYLIELIVVLLFFSIKFKANQNKMIRFKIMQFYIRLNLNCLQFNALNKNTLRKPFLFISYRACLLCLLSWSVTLYTIEMKVYIINQVKAKGNHYFILFCLQRHCHSIITVFLNSK